MKTDIESQGQLGLLRAFARYETHGGYAWAAVTSDGGLLCERCVVANYRQVFRATRDHDRSGWAVIGLTNSGESDGNEICSHCNETLWEHWRAADVMLYLSDARGIYIPRDFAQGTNHECVSGVDAEDWAILENPDHEAYWDVWTDVCDHAIVTSPETGKKYTLYQDGDLWLIEKGAQWDDDLNNARVRI